MAFASSPLPVPVLCSTRGSAATRRRKHARPAAAVSNSKNNRFGHLFEVARKDVEFIKKNVNKGIDWANVAFQVPKVSKALNDVIWLRNLEDPQVADLEPRSLPVPSYPELSGVDLFMADIKALDAYITYFYYMSKVWSKPLPEVYEPQEVADYFNCRPHLVAFRLLEVFFSFTLAAIRIRISANRSVYGASMVDREDGNMSEYHFGMVLKETMLSLGPTFIKVGQSLSTRPDIIGTEISKALSELHDQIPPFPRTEAMKIIEEELGAPVESFFSYVSEEPVAAASFGQVYKCSTLDGVSVAVKVQRPNLRHVVVRDVHILRLGLGLFQRISKRKSDPRLYADELGKGLVGELDYNLEAANASEFREAHSRYSFICVPKVFPQLSRKKVLTMEWIVGENPNDLLYTYSGKLIAHDSRYTEKQQYEAKRRLLDLVNKGVEAALVQLLETGLLHADPHPGNLRYTSTGQMGFLDFGLLCRMEKKHQYAMLASIVHIVNADWASLVHALIDMDVVKPGSNVHRITWDLEDALGDIDFKDGVPDVKFSKVLGKIWSIALKYHLRMPPYYTLVLRSLASLEGLAVATDPSFKTFEAAYPYVVRKLLTDNSAQSRKILHSVVFNKKYEFQWKKLALFLRAGGTGKGLHHLVVADSETFLNPSSDGSNTVFDVANLVLKLLPSKKGLVMRRLLMTADGASLVRDVISEEGYIYRQQICRVIADVLHQWMSEAIGKNTILSKYSSPMMFNNGSDRTELGSSSRSSKNPDYQSLLRDRRLKIIFFKILKSTRKDPVLMLRFGWASFIMLITASALAGHRVLVSLSENIASMSFTSKRFAMST